MLVRGMLVRAHTAFKSKRGTFGEVLGHEPGGCTNSCYNGKHLYEVWWPKFSITDVWYENNLMTVNQDAAD